MPHPTLPLQDASKLALADSALEPTQLLDRIGELLEKTRKVTGSGDSWIDGHMAVIQLGVLMSASDSAKFEGSEALQKQLCRQLMQNQIFTDSFYKMDGLI